MPDTFEEVFDFFEISENISSPKIWTKYPDIVRDVLMRAGFKCGVEPTILPKKENGLERKKEWTCRFEWRGGYAEFYIHKKD